jgi:ribulose-phosphate 3-epimerase
MPDVKLAPSILTADFARLAEQVQAAERGGADILHLDVMDGHFVPNITFGPLLVASLRKVTGLPFDVHLMVDQPDRHVDAFVDAGAQTVNVHVEATSHLHRVIQQIHDRGVRAGVCLNPATPVTAIEEVLAEVDQVMVMTINPGWGGQKLLPATLPKVARIRAMLDERALKADLEIDGGVKGDNIAHCASLGANILVVGSATFNDNASPEDSLAALRHALR